MRGKKKTANYPHFVDKGGGSSNVDKRWKGGGGIACGLKKILIVNIINFQNVDKPRGQGSDNVYKVFC